VKIANKTSQKFAPTEKKTQLYGIRPYQTVSLLSVSGRVGFSGLGCQKTNNTFPDFLARSWLIKT
jgi:hypothetical protein